jgi:hypothetical protein
LVSHSNFKGAWTLKINCDKHCWINYIFLFQYSDIPHVCWQLSWSMYLDLFPVFCISDFTLYSVLTNEEEFADYLHRNLSLPLDDINTLINSTVNIHEVCHTICLTIFITTQWWHLIDLFNYILTILGYSIYKSYYVSAQKTKSDR